MAGHPPRPRLPGQRDRRDLRRQRDQDYDVDALELIGAPDHVILHFRLPEPPQIGDIEVEDGMYHVFRIQGSTITRIEDYVDRAEALRAASLT